MEIKLDINSPPRLRKLRARWSIELQDDLKAYHGLTPPSRFIHELRKAGLKLR